MGESIGAVAARADVLLDAGRLEEALFLAQTAFPADMDHPDLRQVIGLALVRMGRFDEALDFTGALLARDPEDVLNLILRTEALRGAGDLDGAESAARKALSLQPDFLELRLRLAGVLLSGDTPAILEAKALTDGVLAITPEDIDALDTAARICLNLEDLIGFRAYVKRGLALSPHNEELLVLASLDPAIEANERRGALQTILARRPMSEAGRLGMASQVWGEWNKSSRMTWLLSVLFILVLISERRAVPIAGALVVVAALGFRVAADWRIRQHFPPGYASRAARADPFAQGIALASLGALLAAWGVAITSGTDAALQVSAGLAVAAALLSAAVGWRLPWAVARTAGVSCGPVVQFHLGGERQKWWRLLVIGHVGAGILVRLFHGFGSPAWGVVLLATGVGWLAVLPWTLTRVRESGWSDRSARNNVLWASALFILSIAIGTYFIWEGRPAQGLVRWR